MVSWGLRLRCSELPLTWGSGLCRTRATCYGPQGTGIGGKALISSLVYLITRVEKSSSEVELLPQVNPKWNATIIDTFLASIDRTECCALWIYRVDPKTWVVTPIGSSQVRSWWEPPWLAPTRPDSSLNRGDRCSGIRNGLGQRRCGKGREDERGHGYWLPMDRGMG